MFRNHFGRKSVVNGNSSSKPANMKNTTIKKIESKVEPSKTGKQPSPVKAAIPSKPATKPISKPAAKPVQKHEKKLRSHVDCIGSNNVRRVDYAVNGEKKIVYVYLYDNLDYKDTGITLDYCVEDPELVGFNGHSFIPLYQPENGGTPIQPHLDELQDMFMDMISAGQLSTADPTKVELGEPCYDCIIVSDTRTITRSRLGEPGNKLEVKTNILFPEVDEYIWLGLYKEDNKPCFLKLKLIEYRIDTLFVNYGNVVNGVFEPLEQPENVEHVMAYVESDENILTSIPVVYFTNCIQGLLEEEHHPVRDWNAYENMIPVQEQEEYYTGPTWYLNPGQRVRLEPIIVNGVEKGQAIMSEPIIVNVSDQATMWLFEGDTSAAAPQVVAKEVIYEVAVGGGYKTLASNIYVEKDEEGHIKEKKPLLAFAVQGAAQYAATDGTITKDNSRKLLETVKTIANIEVRGPVKVYSINDNGDIEDDKVFYLQFFDSVTFINCDFYDAQDIESGGIRYMWYYNCIFNRCNNHMRYYRTITNEDEIVGNPNTRMMKAGKAVTRLTRLRGAIPMMTSVDEFYNLLMEPRTFNAPGTDLNPDFELLVDQTIKVVGDKQYLILDPTQVGRYHYELKTDGLYAIKYVPAGSNEVSNVTVIGLVEPLKEGQDPASNRVMRLVATVISTDGKGDYTIDGVNYKDIHYGLVGSEWNAELTEKMNHINTILNSASEVSITPLNEGVVPIPVGVVDGVIKTEDGSKLLKKEMLEYIQGVERAVSVMPINMRYINELIGYLAKVLGFEALRLPCVIQSGENRGKGLEGEDAAWIEEYMQDFEKDGVIYKPTKEEGYKSYKFKDDGKHADLVSDLTVMLNGITTLCNEMYAGTGATTTSTESLLYDAITSYLATWEEYYKSQIVPHGDMITNSTEMEIYEAELVYKVFISDLDTNDTTVTKKLVSVNSNGDVSESELEEFITGILDVLKPEIKKICNSEKDVSTFEISDFVAYNDPIKARMSSSDLASEENVDGLSQKNKNDLIEYSQMLSLIQEERNKIQRKGLKDKLIVKFVQTVKGTYFELLATEKIDSGMTSVVQGFFISENAAGDGTQGAGSHEKPAVPKGKSRKSRREMRSIQVEQEIQKIPEVVENEYHLRITKVPVFYSGEPLDWRNDNYYSNKIYLHNLDNLYVGIDPEFAARMGVAQTEEPNSDPASYYEKDMIGYYLVNIIYQE